MLFIVIWAQDFKMFTRLQCRMSGGETDQNSTTPAFDLSDTFNLFKWYLDSSLNSFKKEFLESQEDREIEKKPK